MKTVRSTTLWLMMLHRRIKFGCEMLSGSEGIITKKETHRQTHTNTEGVILL